MDEYSDTVVLVDNILKCAKRGDGLAVHTLNPIEKILMLAKATVSSPPKKTQAELEEAAEKIRRSAVSGICTWKLSCKTGSSRFSYDGVCTDPEVFGALMKLDGPPTWKVKKYKIDEFQEAIGRCTGKVRYDILRLTGNHVNVRYSESGEFKFSGTYGKYQPP